MGEGGRKMIDITLSLRKFLWKYHRDVYVSITFGHLEMYTNEIEKEYIEWCKTEEGKSYLEGGSNYKKEVE